MEHFIAHQAQYWAAIGVVLLIIDVGLLGMASGVLLFAGAGALITGGIMALGLLPETLLAGIGVFAVSTTGSGLALWPQLRRLQNQTSDPSEQRSDFMGQTFSLDEALTREAAINQMFSGVSWRVSIDSSADADSIAVGQEVEIASVKVGALTVRAVSDN